MKYSEFLESKRKNIQESGFDCEPSNPYLFDFQKHIVKTALRKGRYAIFADTGLGKTIMQLSWAYEVCKHENKPVLILAPLAVSGQTIEEGKKFGIEVEKYDSKKELKAIPYIINYEQIDNINKDLFVGIALDESSILKNETGKYRNKLIEEFNQYKYKTAWTATPSPNDFMELGNHSEFVNAMTRTEMLSMFFIHDGGNTQKWRLKKHSINDFWGFVSGWSTLINNPSDIGFNHESIKYNLPNLNYIDIKIKSPKRDNGMLFNESLVNATSFNKELRETLKLRMDKTAEIVNNSKEQFIVWVKQNAEADYLKKIIPDAVEVSGNHSVEYKEKNLLGFANNKFRVLITKSKIAQFGLNYQNCNNQMFPSLDFSFESFYQSIRRSYRFGQKKDVNIYIITTDTMSNIINIIKDKDNKFKEMKSMMNNAINENKSKLYKNESQSTVKSETYKCLKGDVIQRIKDLPDKSIGFSIFSPPFADLYTYSSYTEDMGNSKDYNEFKKHFNYLIPELHRVMQDGRNIAVHCMDLPIQKGKEGYIGLRDFSGMLIDLFQKNGFIYHSRVTIWKNPVTEMQRTKALGLLHKQTKKDATMSRVGIPDYLLIFRKEGINENPVIHQSDNPNESNYLSVDMWQKIASPVWHDINYSNTLQYTTARHENDEKHICPLQLDTIERALFLWSNEGDTMLTPFGGIGSEAYKAIELKRKAVAIELKDSYFNKLVENCKEAEEKFVIQKRLF